MKKKVLVLVIILILSGCSRKEEPHILKKYEATPAEFIVENIEKSKKITILPYSEMSDGTYQVNDRIYKYKLEKNGTVNGGAEECVYIILSNEKDVELHTLSEGLSSLYYDCFLKDSSDAVIVGIR